MKPEQFEISFDENTINEKSELDQEHEELEKLGESLWLTDLFVNKPVTVILSGLFVLAIFTFIAVYFETYWPSPVTNRDFLDYSDITTQLFDAREAAQSEV